MAVDEKDRKAIETMMRLPGTKPELREILALYLRWQDDPTVDFRAEQKKILSGMKTGEAKSVLALADTLGVDMDLDSKEEHLPLIPTGEVREEPETADSERPDEGQEKPDEAEERSDEGQERPDKEEGPQDAPEPDGPDDDFGCEGADDIGPVATDGLADDGTAPPLPFEEEDEPSDDNTDEADELARLIGGN